MELPGRTLFISGIEGTSECSMAVEVHLVPKKPKSKYDMKVEVLRMISESAKRLEFKDKTLPSLEVLLQYSLWLTKNGREAARLMREVMAEAYWRWDESMSEESFKIWLHEILTKTVR